MRKRIVMVAKTMTTIIIRKFIDYDDDDNVDEDEGYNTGKTVITG